MIGQDVLLATDTLVSFLSVTNVPPILAQVKKCSNKCLDFILIKLVSKFFKKFKSSLYLTTKRLMSDGACFRSLVPGQHNSKETAQRWRVVADTVSDLTDRCASKFVSCKLISVFD